MKYIWRENTLASGEFLKDALGWFPSDRGELAFCAAYVHWRVLQSELRHSLEHLGYGYYFRSPIKCFSAISRKCSHHLLGARVCVCVCKTDSKEISWRYFIPTLLKNVNNPPSYHYLPQALSTLTEAGLFAGVEEGRDAKNEGSTHIM